MDARSIERGLDEPLREGGHEFAHDGDLSLATLIPVVVADIRDRRATDLDPLARVVDTDVLEELFDGDARRDRSLQLDFTYEGVRVRLSDDRIAFEPVDGPR
jgi:hypothetical protein